MGTTAENAAEWRRMQRVMRGPDWRWRMAEEFSHSASSGRRGPADTLTRDAADFLSLNRNSEMATQAVTTKRFRKISRAVALLADETRAGELKILALGGCRRSEIAARLGVEEDTIECFEELFFDVREMKSHSAWVYCFVIRRESEASAYDLGAKLRLAFSGGPELAKRMLDTQIDVPTDEADRIIGREILLHAKLCAVMDMPLSNEERMSFVEAYLDYQKHKETLNLEEAKLALQFATAETAGVDSTPDTEL